ncbi:hypothetical protein AeRB84_010958 [Aphanomyces euteiches]|nr:hypothetical protein AeRB84_010958 [Aphanomyces euteiches]
MPSPRPTSKQCYPQHSKAPVCNVGDKIIAANQMNGSATALPPPSNSPSKPTTPPTFSTYSSIRPTTSMASPLSKRKNKWQKRRPMTVSSTFRPISIVELPGPECNPSFGLLQLDEWLATYEHDILQYDSLAAFAHVKLDEARRLSSKCPHPMNRFRVAVMCNLFERAACALATSESFKRYSSCILALRDEILDMVLVDVQDDDAVATIARNVPRTLSFFLQKMPHVIALRLEQEKKAMDFHKHQAVLQKLIQTMFKNVGSVFQAWKLFAKAQREERLSKKAAKITRTILATRNQTRLVFVSWARHCLVAKLEAQRLRGIQLEREHTLRVAELKKSMAQSTDTIDRLQAELNMLRVRHGDEPAR